MLNIKTDNFEGPFDMLLFLIKKNKMNIYDIEIHKITEQYIGIINKMQEMDLEVTSEFILMASMLIEIKSIMLLPKAKHDDTEEAVDPRTNLMDKLIEYKKIKMAAEFISKKEIGIMFSKKAEIICDKPIDIDNVLNNVSLIDLYNLFLKLTLQYSDKINKNNTLQKQVYTDIFKVEDKMKEIMKLLYNKKSYSFSEIADNCTRKSEVVVMFLAILELIKLKNIKVYQESNYKDIFIEKNEIER